ncbi:MAG: hypothetical protein IJB36_02070 [Clostridia bacterium]|nr:hypothetical protein [Clostridia bacterium]
MSKGKKILNIVLYVFLALVLFYQILGLISVIWGSAIFGAALPAKLQEAKGLIPTWIATTILVFGAVVLGKVWKNKEKQSLIPMVMGIVGAALALIVALTLRAALPLQAANSNVSTNGMQGLSDWKLFWRHYSVVGVGLVAAVVNFLHFKDARNERIRKENESYQEHFVLDGDPLFADEEKASPAKSKKLSKKQRKELREKENGGN